MLRKEKKVPDSYRIQKTCATCKYCSVQYHYDGPNCCYCGFSDKSVMPLDIWDEPKVKIGSPEWEKRRKDLDKWQNGRQVHEYAVCDNFEPDDFFQKNT
jgi:hypothetical protein